MDASRGRPVELESGLPRWRDSRGAQELRCTAEARRCEAILRSQ